MTKNGGSSATAFHGLVFSCFYHPAFTFVLLPLCFAKKPVFYITRILFSVGTGNIFYYQFPWLYRNSYVN